MDPLLSGGIGLHEVLIVVFKVVLAFVFLLIATMMMIWFERKLISDMQNRIGPNRAGKWGLLQSLADGIKAFFKEDLKPANADIGVFKLAPYLSLVPAFLLFAIIPIGGVFQNGNNGVVSMFGKDTLLQVADPQIGVLFALAMSSVAVYGVMLAGWSSGSKYPLLGAVRASAQMVSYEAALGLSVAAVVLVTGGLRTNQIVAEQATWGWNLWTAGVVPFIVFVIAATAELNRPPFDLVEAEQELVGGFHTEYSSIRFAMFYLAEFMNTITMSGIIVTLFLGGPNGPLLLGPDWIWPPVWFFAKLFCLLFMFVWFRATLPRVRYDQLMDLGWKVLIPIALGWLLLLGALRLARDDALNLVDNENANLALVMGIAIIIVLVAASLLLTAIQTARDNRDESVEAFD